MEESGHVTMETFIGANRTPAVPIPNPFSVEQNTRSSPVSVSHEAQMERYRILKQEKKLERERIKLHIEDDMKARKELKKDHEQVHIV